VYNTDDDIGDYEAEKTSTKATARCGSTFGHKRATCYISHSLDQKIRKSA
jgi:hypothetical protein